MGKGGWCMRLTTSPPSRAQCHEIWEHKPPGTLWATPGLLRNAFTFTFTVTIEYLRSVTTFTELVYNSCTLVFYQQVILIIAHY